MLIKSSDSSLIDQLCAIFDKNGIAIIKCDTIYGIVGNVPDSAEKIRMIKKRDDGKHFLMLIPDESWFAAYADQALPEELRIFWPGPLSIVVRAKTGGTIALRVPDDRFLRELVKRTGRPLYSTSVNTSNEPPLHRIRDIIEKFESSVDCIVDSGDLENGVASTIIDITERPFRIIRQGLLRIDERLLG